MSARCCPNCARRFVMLIDPDCPVCGGAGVLTLGAAAVTRYTDEVASRAVELALEVSARRDLADPAVDMLEARRHLTMTVDRLRSRGLLARDAADTATRQSRGSMGSVHRRAAVMTEGYERGDSERLDRPPVDFQPDDRPMQNGDAPGFSLAFRVCALARVADPIDAMRQGRSVRELVTGRYTTERQATLLAAAGTLALFDERGRPKR